MVKKGGHRGHNNYYCISPQFSSMPGQHKRVNRISQCPEGKWKEAGEEAKDWERLKTAFLKVRDQSKLPDMFIYAHISDLRKADNRGIDHVIRRLFLSKEYGNRIRLHGGPSSSYPRHPLVVRHFKLGLGENDYRYYLIEIPEFVGSSIQSDGRRGQ